MQDYTSFRATARKKWQTLVEVYGSTCAYCLDNPATQIDHAVPVSYHATNHISNLRPCCEWCNLLAADRVFETFEDKFEWLRQERLRRRFGNHKRTVCTVCRLPYQRPLHSPNLFLCPECYDREYNKALRLRVQWREWLELCKRAGFVIEAHRALVAWQVGLRGTSLTLEQRAAKLAEFYAEYNGEWEIEGIRFPEEQPETRRVYLVKDITGIQGRYVLSGTSPSPVFTRQRYWRLVQNHRWKDGDR